jgi:hypothetical protein
MQSFERKHANRRFSIMSLNSDYLQELSDLFVADMKKSAFYRNLSEKQRKEFDARLQEEAAQGLYPLLPGATEEELARLSKAMRKELGILVPDSVLEILRQVDGLVENGVSLYGVDPEFRDDQFDSGPGLLAENRSNWSAYAETIQKYFFLGDSDLWFFAIELSSGRALAIDRSTLAPKHPFATVEEMVNDMMHQALGYLEEYPDLGAEDVPNDLFSRN